MDQGLPRSVDLPPPTDLAQFPILYQDVWLKDKRWVKLSKLPPTPQPRPRKASLRKHLEWGQPRLLLQWLLSTCQEMMVPQTYLSLPPPLTGNTWWISSTRTPMLTQ